MEQDQRQGVTIPGYQPVEMLGNAPSYGVWVRAVQTRMDRHVLLKLLPPGLPLAHDSFSREIQTLVRLDGHGVLRVIDEGTSSGVRYLVVDEAEGRLIEDAPPAGSAGWQDLGETLEECYRRVTDLGLVMLPIPPIALRRLPAGRFALADLGWLVPAGNKLPAHPSVPAELAGEPAALGMNGRFLARTLRGLPETLGRTAPRSWRRAIAALEERSDRQADDDPFAQPILRGRIEAIPSRLSAPSLGLVALLLVVAAAWATSYFIGENAGQEVEQPAAAVAEEEGANGTGSGQGTVSPVVEEIPAAPGPESETEAQGELEERAALLLAEILPEPQVPLPLPLPPEKGRRLETLRDRFRGTRAAACAERNLRAGREALAERLHALWEPLMAQISEHLSGGRLDSAESLILEGQEAVSAHSGSPVMAEVAAQVLALRRRMGAAAQVRRRALAARIEQHRAARDHGAAIAAIDAALAGLPSEERRWAEAERAALEAQGERYRGAIRALEGALAEMLLTCEDGAWDDARALLNRADPGADFPEMRGRWERWSGWLRRARAMGEGLRSALGSSGRAETPHPYRRAAGTSALRGRVLSAEPAAFTLKIHGRKNTETIPYRDLDLSSIEEIVGERRGPPGAEGPLLLLFFLGAVDRAISGARELAEAPQWLEAAITRKESDRDRSITSALDRGRKAAAAGDWAGAREVVLELGTRFPAAELTPHLEEMRRWLSGYWQERGAPAAFPGAEGEWDRRARRIRLRYDFSGEEALADWRGARRSSLLEQRQGAMHVRGSVWLAPGGTTGIFEGDLRVIAEMLPLQLAAPNLNLVLWAREPADSRAGLLFGLGFKPPKLASMMRDETQVLLPANVIGPLVMAEGGITRALGYLRVVPRIERREVVRLEVASDARGSTLRWNDRIRQRSAPYPNGLRRGTVEIRTYTSSVLVRTMEIEGRVRAGWWGRWVKKRIASELPGP